VQILFENMTDKGTIKSGSKYERHRLKRPDVTQEYANKLVTYVEE
jgi:hypothetical protein